MGDSGMSWRPTSRMMQGTTAEPSIHCQPFGTLYRKYPTNAATVAPRYHAADTMPMEMERCCLGVNSAMSDVAMG